MDRPEMKQAREGRPAELSPDISRCRVVELGGGAYVECQCAGPNECRFALPFGYGYLCQHPHFNKGAGHPRAAARTGT